MRSLRICSPGLRLVERLRLGEHHSGFNVYCGPAIWPHDEDALENLAHYIIRAAFSQDPPASPIIVRLRSDTARQRAAHSFSGHWGRHWRAGRMTYVSEDQSSAGNPKAIYQSKDGKTSKTFDALDWLAQLTTHIPGKNEQMVRYYGYYSNKSRGMRRRVGKQDDVPALIDSDLSAKEFRRNWARLIQKVYEVDPLICPKCEGETRVISVIEDQAVTRLPCLSMT